MNPLLYTLFIGAVAGWLAGFFVKGIGLGIIGNIIIGVLGAFVGNWLLGQLNMSFSQSTFGQIMTAAIGGVVLLFVIGLFRKSS